MYIQINRKMSVDIADIEKIIEAKGVILNNDILIETEIQWYAKKELHN